MKIQRIRFSTPTGEELSVHTISQSGRSRVLQYIAEGEQWGAIADEGASIIWSMTDDAGAPLLPKMRKWFDDPNNLG